MNSLQELMSSYSVEDLKNLYRESQDFYKGIELTNLKSLTSLINKIQYIYKTYELGVVYTTEIVYREIAKRAMEGTFK